MPILHATHTHLLLMLTRIIYLHGLEKSLKKPTNKGVFEIIHVQSTVGHEFATRLANVFIIGKEQPGIGVEVCPVRVIRSVIGKGGQIIQKIHAVELVLGFTF